MLITMHVGELLSFWARTLTTAYSVLAFFGYLGFVYAGPIADQKIRTTGPAIDGDTHKKCAALVPFIPRRATALEYQVFDKAA
jgi:hypothetical protein